MSGSQNMGNIPDGWIDCPREPLQIISDEFVVFKTPLHKRYNHRIITEKRFHVETIFSSVNKKKLHLGLWIDLTNTNRYFNKFEVKNMGCTYVKIRCAGKAPPTRYQVNKFIDICRKFRRENSSLIAVHCTHGFNRTGFMIVSYLIEVFNLNVTQAINKFAEARPPGIYRQYLINELYNRYSHEDEAPLPIQQLPPWI